MKKNAMVRLVGKATTRKSGTGWLGGSGSVANGGPGTGASNPTPATITGGGRFPRSWVNMVRSYQKAHPNVDVIHPLVEHLRGIGRI